MVDFVGKLDGALLKAGEVVTLRRIAPDPVGDTYIAATVSCRAAVRVGKSPGDLVDPDMGDVSVVLSPTGLAAFGVPQLFDLVEAQGETVGVKSVSPIYIGTELVRINLVARGGAEILDQQVTILRAAYTENDLGEQVATWVPLTTVWASKTDIRDSERFAAQEVASTITTRFRFRWSSLVADVTPEDRATCEDREYEIVAVKEIGRREGLELTASARAER
jgi:SPP1 family predicted phage head-tail adaptor